MADETTVRMALSDDDKNLLKRTVLQKASAEECEIFHRQVERTGLDPFARQIMADFRWNTKLQREVMTIITTIDGFRLIAERSGHYAGQLGPEWCGADGKWVDVWLEEKPPAAARVGVLRHDFREPLWAVARFEAYAAYKENRLTYMWRKMWDLMIGKCAEALALRRAFPIDLSGLYTADEMQQASNEAAPEPPAPAAPDTPRASAQAPRQPPVDGGAGEGVAEENAARAAETRRRQEAARDANRRQREQADRRRRPTSAADALAPRADESGERAEVPPPPPGAAGYRRPQARRSTAPAAARRNAKPSAAAAPKDTKPAAARKSELINEEDLWQQG